MSRDNGQNHFFSTTILNDQSQSQAHGRSSQRSAGRPQQPIFGTTSGRAGSQGNNMEYPYLPVDSQMSPGNQGAFAPYMNSSGFPQSPNYPDEVVLNGQNGEIVVGRTDSVGLDPINRFYKESQEAPFTLGAEGVTSWTTTDHRIVRQYAGFNSYREHPGSNPDSQMTGPRQHADSGYDTRSAISEVHEQMQSEEASSIVMSANAMRLDSNNQPFYSRNPYPTHVTEFDSQNHEASTANKTCRVEGCKIANKLMNASDYRKHMQRHDKPFKCTVSGCMRQEGFTTKNDLERHQKSLHKITPTNSSDRSFKCQGKSCNKRNKVWPRLDNFKSHCQRMHKDEDADTLIKNSEITLPSPPPPSTALSSQSPNPNPLASHNSQAVNRDEEEENATLLLGVSQGPHGQKATAVGVSRQGQQSSPERAQSQGYSQKHHSSGLAIDDSTQSKTNKVQQANKLTVTTHGSPMVHSRSGHLSQPSPSQGNSLSPGGSTRGSHRHSPHSSVSLTSPQSAGGVFVDPIRTSPAQQPRDAGFSHRKSSVEEFSKNLASDLAREFKIPISQDALQSLIASRVSQMTKTSPKRSADEAGLGDPDEPSGTPSSLGVVIHGSSSHGGVDAGNSGSNGNGGNNSNNGTGRMAKKVTCPNCSKTMGRPCDLKKHQKRHSRPWGCTNESCSKSFGSKNDWKRHENSQHYQLETWRCAVRSESSRIKTCAKTFSRREPFVAHLRKEHGMADEAQLRDECRARRIGRNWQSGFWCGFCRDIIKLHKKGIEAWDERFNHIDNEHFKNGKRIEDWYPIDKDVPKGELRQEGRKGDGGGGGRGEGKSGRFGGRGAGKGSGEADSYDDDDDDYDDDDDESSELENVIGEDRDLTPAPAPTEHNGAAGADHDDDDHYHNDSERDGGSRRGDIDGGTDAAHRKKRSNHWYCSQCGFGPWDTVNDGQCSNCQHRKCSHCRNE